MTFSQLPFFSCMHSIWQVFIKQNAKTLKNLNPFQGFSTCALGPKDHIFNLKPHLSQTCTLSKAVCTCFIKKTLWPLSHFSASANRNLPGHPPVSFVGAIRWAVYCNSWQKWSCYKPNCRQMMRIGRPFRWSRCGGSSRSLENITNWKVGFDNGTTGETEWSGVWTSG